jgi:hypothetical protein
MERSWSVWSSRCRSCTKAGGAPSSFRIIIRTIDDSADAIDDDGKIERASILFFSPVEPLESWELL